MPARERYQLYPPIEPHAQSRLKVTGGHEIYYEECGNPAGKPVVDRARRTGRGCNPTMRRYHDPARYRIVLFDQRGCGRSMPHASLEANTTWDLVADMERLRTHLGIAALAVVRRVVGLDAVARICRDASRSRARSGDARHLPAAAGGAEMVLPGRLQLAVSRCVRRFRRLIPLAERGDLIERLLSAADASRPAHPDRGGAGVVGLRGLDAVAAAGSRAVEAVLDRHLCDRVRTDRVPLLHQQGFSRDRRSTADQRQPVAADSRARSCMAAMTS